MKKTMSTRKRRHIRVRKKISGTSERPRLNVFRSTKHIYVQAIDDTQGKTLAAASSLITDLPSIEKEEVSGKSKTAMAVGMLLAKKLLDLGIKNAIFDRGGYLYHGRVQALADGAREGGLKI